MFKNMISIFIIKKKIKKNMWLEYLELCILISTAHLFDHQE